jgi:hypothetical protein
MDSLANDVWYSGIYKSLLISSAVAFSIYSTTTDSISFNALVSGYSILILGISMLMLFVFNKSTNTSSVMVPFILLFIIISIMLYLLTNNKTRITNGQVSPSFYNFSNISVFLVLIQVYLIYSQISTVEFKKDKVFNRTTSLFVTLLSVLSGICTYIIYTVLVYYTADGFSLITHSS